MKEVWKEIEGFPYYAISNLGNVYNRRRDIELKISVNQQGIAHVHLYQDGRQHVKGVAPMVAKAFLAPPRAAHFDTPINLDGDRENNRVDNLEWRPRWFAIKYHQQHKVSEKRILSVPIMEYETEEIFETAWHAAMRFGCLEKDVITACINWTPVFPGGQQFRFIEDTDVLDIK